MTLTANQLDAPPPSYIHPWIHVCFLIRGSYELHVLAEFWCPTTVSKKHNGTHSQGHVLFYLHGICTPCQTNNSINILKTPDDVIKEQYNSVKVSHSTVSYSTCRIIICIKPASRGRRAMGSRNQRTPLFHARGPQTVFDPYLCQNRQDMHCIAVTASKTKFSN